MADHVYPEDSGTGASEGDWSDAANFAQLARAIGLVDFVSAGMGFTLDAATPSLDIASGQAVLTDASATATNTSETRDNVAYLVDMDARSGLSLTDGDVNHVFVSADLTTDDTISVTINTTDSAPAEPSLKIGTVDTTNDTTTELNRNPDISVDNLTLAGTDIDSDGDGVVESFDQTLLQDGNSRELELDTLAAGNSTADDVLTGDGAAASWGKIVLANLDSTLDKNALDGSAGTDGQVWTSTGSGAQWEDTSSGGGGAWNYVTTITDTNTGTNLSLDTGTLGTTYDIYQIFITAYNTDGADANLDMQLNGDTTDNYNQIHQDGTSWNRLDSNGEFILITPVSWPSSGRWSGIIQTTDTGGTQTSERYVSVHGGGTNQWAGLDKYMERGVLDVDYASVDRINVYFANRTGVGKLTILGRNYD